MQLLLSELKSSVTKNIQSFDTGSFLGVYCCYVMSGTPAEYGSLMQDLAFEL
jgi:hypothetical protein